MRASLVGVLGLVWIAGALGCGETHSRCGSGGTFVVAGDTEHCVYSRALPIVIEGGFECPGAMPFELDLNTHRVCSARPVDNQHLPPALCAEMPELCSASEGPPALPELDAGRAANDPRQHATWTDCNSRTLEEGLTGDRCAPAGNGCGTSSESTCSVTAAICDPAGILKVSELEVLECAKSETDIAAQDARVYRGAQDCEVALAEGHSFDACEGSFVCARRTEEPCCIEYALCNTDAEMSTQLLLRYRFCERGCATVEPDERRERASDCSAFDIDPESADLPCEGDFVCWGGDDLSDGRGVDVDLNATAGVRWCSEGVVHGQHSTIGPAFLPPGPAAP